MTLTEFLLARIAEDDEVGRKAAIEGDGTVCVEGAPCLTWGVQDYTTDVTYPNARVQAECEAKRRIVAAHQPIGKQWTDGATTHPCECMCVDCAGYADEWPCATLQAIALPYADHPDFRPEWCPPRREDT